MNPSMPIIRDLDPRMHGDGGGGVVPATYDLPSLRFFAAASPGLQNDRGVHPDGSRLQNDAGAGIAGRTGIAGG